MQMIGTPVISGFYSSVTVHVMVDCIDSSPHLNLEGGELVNEV